MQDIKMNIFTIILIEIFKHIIFSIFFYIYGFIHLTSFKCGNVINLSICTYILGYNILAYKVQNLRDYNLIFITYITHR